VGYLDLLDGILRGGAQALGGDFIDAQVTWIEGRQAPDGGFPGRAGPADIYYTDFALRALDLVAPDSPAFAGASEYLRRSPRAPDDVVGAFSLLSCERLLSRRGIAVGLDRSGPARVLAAHALPDGGFGAPGAGEISAYDSFLGTLCREMLGEDPGIERAAVAVRRLHRPSGGFAEREAGEHAQTNATAAAIAVLVMAEDLRDEEAEGAARFLIAAQALGGGLRAHPAAPEADLLSTFTGTLTLSMLGSGGELDLPAVGRFVGAVARSGGGFGASLCDDGADVEYAYYGIATLALLRSIVGAG